MKRLLIQSCIFLVSCFSCLTGFAQDQGSNWTHVTDLPVIRAGFSVNHIDGKLYVIGGEQYNPDGAIADVDIYDIEADEWTKGTPMPTARFLVPKLTIGNMIYAIGGNKNHFEAGQKVEVYDVTSDEWTSAADMPTSRNYCAGCVLDGKIYVMGGWSLDMISGEDIYGLNTMERYDPATDTWDTCAPMPTGRFALTACALDGKIYVIGGSKPISEGALGYATVEVYDPETDQWTTISSMNHPRFELTSTVIDGKIWAMYGFPDGNPPPVHSHFEVYDPLTDTWTLHDVSEDLHPQGFAPIHAIYADTLYIFGGYGGSGNNYLNAEVYLYDTTTADPGTSVGESVIQDMRIFPNPASERLTIQTNLTGPFDVEFTTLNGQLIHFERMEGTSQQIDLSSFQKGIYFITIRSKDFVTTRKIIKL